MDKATRNCNRIQKAIFYLAIEETIEAIRDEHKHLLKSILLHRRELLWRISHEGNK